MRRLLAAAALAAAACSPSRGPRAEPLWSLPDFTMRAVAEAGERDFKRADLEGRVWIAEFVFTRCAGPCPRLTRRLVALGRELPEEIGLLAVSVDPEGDDAGRLRDYARAFAAPSGRWVFLRGSVSETYRLAYEGFRLPLSTNPGAPGPERAVHSTRFVLLDRRARVRGYYEGLDDRENAALARDARRLLEESA